MADDFRTAPHRENRMDQTGNGRIAMFTDAVIAIILAIMVLELRLPEAAGDPSWAELLLPLAPKFATYAVSFVTVAVIWVHHHQLLRAIRRSSRRLMWLNNLLLFCLSLVPAATGYLGAHFGQPRALAIYAAVLMLATLAFALIRGNAMLGARRNPAFYAFQRRVLLVILAGAGLYGLAAGLAFVSVEIAMGLLVMAPLVFFIPIKRAGAPGGGMRGAGKPGEGPPSSGWRRQATPPAGGRGRFRQDLDAIEKLVPGGKKDG